MDNTILSFLQARKKKTILLNELERLVGGQTSYEDFALLINDLEQKGILTAVKQQGYNQKPIPLANAYRIAHSKIPADFLQEIERFHFLLDPLIKLEAYYNLASSDPTSKVKEKVVNLRQFFGVASRKLSDVLHLGIKQH